MLRKKRILWLVALLALWGGAALPREPSPAPQEDPVYDELLKINYVFNRELYDIAIPRYEKLLEKNEDYPRAHEIHYALALCYYNLAIGERPEGSAPSDKPPTAGARNPLGASTKGRLKKAVLHLKKAMRNNRLESKAEAAGFLGQSLLLLGDWKDAATTFRWILERSGSATNAEQARMGLAESLYLQSNYTQAAKVYREVLEHKPAGDDRERAAFYLAMSLYRLGDGSAQESIPHFERISARSGGKFTAEARYMVALSRQAGGDDQGALDAFRELMASGPGLHDELGQFGLAAAYFRMGKYRQAAEQFNRFLQEFPSGDRRDQASLYLALTFLERKQTSKAMRGLEALRTSPAVGDEASLRLARIYTRDGETGRAIRLLKMAIKAFPTSVHRESLELELASAGLAQGTFEEAGEILSRLESREGAASVADQVAYLKAYALHRAEKYAESESAARSFVETYPESRYVADAVQLEAENRFLAGEYAGAFKAYGRFLDGYGDELDGPTRLKAQFRTAQALYLQKKYAEARTRLEALHPSALGADTKAAFHAEALFVSYHYLLGESAYQLEDHASATMHLTVFLDAMMPQKKPSSSTRTTGLEEQVRDARFKVAHAFQLGGDFAKASHAYREALKTDPESPHREQILFELAQIAYLLGDYEKAREGFSLVLKEAQLEEGAPPRFVPHSLRFLGWMASKGGDPEAAERYYRKLVERFPSHELAAEGEFQLALCLDEQGKASEVRQVLSNFREKYPGDARLGRVQITQAVSLGRENKHREALVVLTKIRAGNPSQDLLPTVLYETAWCHRALSDPDAAAAAYQELLALPREDSLSATARLELGELEFERENYAVSRELLKPLTRGDSPHREKALYRVVWCYHSLDDAKGTTEAYGRFVKAFPQSEVGSELGILAARAHLATSNHKKAGEIFRSIADGGPAKAEAEIALVSYGECLAEQREFERAQKSFTRFLERYPDSSLVSRARFGEAWADENLGKLNRAMKGYRQVVRQTKAPLGARAQFQLGQCHVAKKEHREAIVEFLQVPASFGYPEWSSKALLQVAGCFEALGDEGNARKYYTEVASSFPDRDEARFAKERLQRLETD